MESGKVASYVVDFPEPATANMPGAIVTPHLGASTEEAEENCAAMAVDQIREYFENGNLVNSVTFPGCSLERTGAHRATILFKGESIADKVSCCKVLNSKEAKKGDYGVLIVDTDDDICADCFGKIEGVLGVQVL